MCGGSADQRYYRRVVGRDPGSNLQAVRSNPLHQPARTQQQRAIIDIIDMPGSIDNADVQPSVILESQFTQSLAVQQRRKADRLHPGRRIDRMGLHLAESHNVGTYNQRNRAAAAVVDSEQISMGSDIIGVIGAEDARRSLYADMYR